MQIANIINQLNLKLRRYKLLAVNEIVPGSIEVVVEFAHYKYSILHTNRYSVLQDNHRGLKDNSYTRWVEGLLNNYVRDADGNMIDPNDNKTPKVPVVLSTDKVGGGHRRVCPPVSLF